MTGARFIVRGVVQGVGFRWFAAHAAQSLGARGHVLNLPDGSVEVVAWADGPQPLERLGEQLRKGPSNAVVDSVERQELSDDEYHQQGSFQIR
jgi:acylphosphatase